MLIVIVGPTASGKSSIAHRLALTFNGEIVNADSVQIYRGLTIGSAAPSEAERQEVPYHLVASHSLDEEVNAAIFSKEAHRCVADIIARHKIPFLVGGTHFWVDTFLHGLSPVPALDDTTRAHIRERFKERTTEDLFLELSAADPRWATTISSPNDRQRIERGLEVFYATGKPLSFFHTLPKENRYTKPFLKIAVHQPREMLLKRIAQRTHTMLNNGLIEEVTTLRAQGYTAENCRPLATIGYKETNDFIEKNKENISSLEAEITLHTGQLAKRQTVWLKKDFEAFRIQDYTAAELLVRIVTDRV